MVGSIFNKCLESSGNNFVFKFIPISDKLAKSLYKFGFKINKKFRGMSTKEVQKEWGNTNLKTSEGIVTYREVEYTIKGWVDNFESYLRSAMSYSNAKTLKEFIGEADIIKISNNAYKRFNK
jgi:GMP reductase